MKKVVKKLVFWFGVGLISISSFAFVSGYFEVSKNLDIFTSLFREVNIYYVDETKPGEMIEKAIDSMLKDLDPYTTYIPESEIEDFRFQTTGQYGGIGSTIRKREDYVIISEPYKGFPADKAGLKAGDRLIEIDGKSVKGKSTQDVSSVLKGQPGVEVNLLIERPGTEGYINKTFTREEVKVKSIPYKGMVADGIGYVRLRSFTRNCSNEVKEAIMELKDENELKGLVLDLRSNPGGLLNESVNLCNLFIDKGQEVVSTKGKIKDWEKSYKTSKDPLDRDLPLVVLINQSSASASEIVSGTMQDLDRGVVIGKKSFGKGLVQQTRKLSYNSQVKVTVAKYYTPSGRCIQALDYAHRNEDGSVGKVPDSLKTAFQTKNGRLVYDGGGVDPDISVDKAPYAEILGSLVSKQLIFDYATQFVLDNDTIGAPGAYKIDDLLYEDFVSFLSDKDYEYETITEKELAELIELADDEYSDFKDDLVVLQKKLLSYKEDDIHKYQSEISELLLSELMTRYHYQEGRVIASLANDPVLEEAIIVLNDKSRYDAILSGDKKSE
ncbi:S41 family peptidase [Flavobacteriales bacterium]|jgi:carboxyl-terminal processing protease|nr:S41 family peptidase [Flavobacteriales bacterium]